MCKSSRTHAQREYSRDYYAKLKDAGICVSCCSVPALPNQSRCAGCLISVNEASKRRNNIVAAERKAAGMCVRCGRPKTGKAKTLCLDCVKQRNETINAMRARWRAAGLCVRCGSTPLPGRVRCRQCSRKNTVSVKIYRSELRHGAIMAYGGYVCACCGETTPEFLEIDHVNNDGAEHRRQIGVRGGFYGWLKTHRYPPGFQVLCSNCNMAKGRYGECPHQRNRRLLQTQKLA
jgi:hypothetical protein